MEFLSDLWLPIVVSAAFVWVASAIIHMVLPIHKGEWKGLPDENRVTTALEGVPAGQYMFPFGSMADMKNPEFVARQKKGPNGTLVLWNGPANIGQSMLLMLIFDLVVGVFVAYVAWHALPKGTPYLQVFRICGAAAFMAHGLGWIPNMIWFGRSARSFWSYLFDSIVYAGLTAGTFGWLWPK